MQVISLKEFIKQTISEVIEGVKEARQAVPEKIDFDFSVIQKDDYLCVGWGDAGNRLKFSVPLFKKEETEYKEKSTLESLQESHTQKDQFYESAESGFVPFCQTSPFNHQ